MVNIVVILLASPDTWFALGHYFYFERLESFVLIYLDFLAALLEQ